MLIAIVGAFPNFGTRSMSDKFSFPKQSQASFEFEQLELLFRSNPLKQPINCKFDAKNTGKYYTNMKQQKKRRKNFRPLSQKGKQTKACFNFCVQTLGCSVYSGYPQNLLNPNPNRTETPEYQIEKPSGRRENNSKQPSSRSSTWRMNAIF